MAAAPEGSSESRRCHRRWGHGRGESRAGAAGSGRRVLLVEGVALASQCTAELRRAHDSARQCQPSDLREPRRVGSDRAPRRRPSARSTCRRPGGFGFARLRAEEQGIEAFGYVVANRRHRGGAVGAACGACSGCCCCACLPVRAASRLPPRACAFTWSDGSAGRERVAARLLVAADGAQSQIRTAAGIEAAVEDYDQVAIVANVAADRPHAGLAYERFTAPGPLAVLPLLRWQLCGDLGLPPAARAASCLSFDEDELPAQLQPQFGWRAGRFVRAGRRGSYPLKLTRAAATVGDPHGADRQRCPGAAPGRRAGIQSWAARCGDACGGDCRCATRRCRCARAAAALRRVARAPIAAAWSRFTDGLVKLFGRHAHRRGAAAQSGIPAVRSRAAGEECAGAGERGLRRTYAATRAWPAGASVC